MFLKKVIIHLIKLNFKSNLFNNYDIRNQMYYLLTTLKKLAFSRLGATLLFRVDFLLRVHVV
ncbi:hypothetical protein NUSPORA_01524 [Nucleospora cyclopteri]